MRQIEVFVAQLGEVTLVKGILLIVLWDGLQFEETCLSGRRDGGLQQKVGDYAPKVQRRRY